jgi:hypothetical protein
VTVTATTANGQTSDVSVVINYSTGR